MTCPWNNKESIKIEGCPILWHTLYPYFLGLTFKADYGGDCCVSCPANVDTLVKIRPYDNRFEGRVPENWRDVIHAEVVRVKGDCDFDYKVGDIILFPTFAKKDRVCPAGIYNIFPFLDIKIPFCVDKRKLRCPDWKEDITYEL